MRVGRGRDGRTAAGRGALAGLWLIASLGIALPAASAPKRPAAPSVRVSGSLAFELIYDDNVIHYSDADLEEFATVSAPGKFSIRQAGDHIVRPMLTLNAETKALTGQKLETQLRLTSWWYLADGVKNNESINLRFKHPGFGRDNFQFTLYHAPQQYLRNYRDRPPTTPPSDPMEYTTFSITSTSASLGYWRGISKKTEGRLELRRSWRYYNQAFMENDNWEWRFGGYLGYRLAGPLKVTAEYFYSDVRARAADEAGETAETSDEGDASYERDHYRLALDFYLKKGFLRVKHFAVEGQYQAFYFTSRKPLAEDPFHVGRKDQVYQFEFTWDTPPVLGPISLEGGYRYAERNSSAPGGASGGEGIDEDKDYNDNRGWVGMEVPF